eukprot:8113182-Pyramimonas_sp.AAC.1
MEEGESCVQCGFPAAPSGQWKVPWPSSSLSWNWPSNHDPSGSTLGTRICVPLEHIQTYT